MQVEIKQIFNVLDGAVSDFQVGIPGVQEAMLNEITKLAGKLKVLKNGRIANSMENLKILKQISTKLKKIIINPKYKDKVAKFVEAFEQVALAQQKYFDTLEIKVGTSKYLDEIKAQAIDSTLVYLTEAGINANVMQPVQDILRQNITTGGSMNDFMDQVRKFILTDPNGLGALERYTTQITTDAIHQYSRQYMNAITASTNMEWYMYVGSLKTTSREWCQYLTKKLYIHKSELATIIHSHIDDTKVCSEAIPCYAKTGLPRGMVEGTNEATVLVYAGGYNCGHKFIPILELAVPKDIRDRTYYSQEYLAWCQKEGVKPKKSDYKPEQKPATPPAPAQPAPKKPAPVKPPKPVPAPEPPPPPAPKPANLEFEAYAKAKEQQLEWSKWLSKGQIENIQAYTQEGGELWNNYLRNGEKGVPPEVLGFVESATDNLISTLMTAPNFETTVYRGMSFFNKQHFQGFLKVLKEGGIFMDKGMMSTSLNEMMIEPFMDQGEYFAKITIQGKTGKLIGELSANPHEEEVIFLPGTKFEITKVTKKGTNQVHIEMKEYLEPPKPVYKGIEMKMEEGMPWVSIQVEKAGKTIDIGTIAIDGNHTIMEGEIDEEYRGHGFYQKAILDYVREYGQISSVFRSRLAERSWELLIKNLPPEMKYTKINHPDEGTVEIKVEMKPVPKKTSKEYEELSRLTKSYWTSSRYDIGVIQDYSGSFGTGINNYERYGASYGTSAELTKKYKTKSELISKILKEAPKYQGWVERGMDFTEASFNEFMGKVQEGGIFIDKGFMSTTLDPKVIRNFATPEWGVEMKIYTKSGVLIDAISYHAGEKEVLIDKGTKFLITKVTRMDKKAIIELKEL